MSTPDDETAPDGAVGQRVAAQRKLAGLAQYQLADRAHVSTSLVSQVERGTV
ncbi:MAG: helix-turn-helix domain-containing protein, partial [Pseudonocardiaceae bacterium]